MILGFTTNATFEGESYIKTQQSIFPHQSHAVCHVTSFCHKVLSSLFLMSIAQMTYDGFQYTSDDLTCATIISFFMKVPF